MNKPIAAALHHNFATGLEEVIITEQLSDRTYRATIAFAGTLADAKEFHSYVRELNEWN
jgi:hypothetical protein